MLLTFCPSTHQNSHSTPSPGSCTCFSLCKLPSHSTGITWLTLTGHMGCGMRILRPILMFLTTTTWFPWCCLPSAIPGVIVTTKDSYDYHQVLYTIQLTNPTYMMDFLAVFSSGPWHFKKRLLYVENKKSMIHTCYWWKPEFLACKTNTIC